MMVLSFFLKLLPQNSEDFALTRHAFKETWSPFWTFDFASGIKNFVPYAPLSNSLAEFSANLALPNH
jgi:hypothetical protein